MMLLEVKDLTIESRAGTHIVGPLTFPADAGETFCIVGESGSGKTCTARCLTGLLPPNLVASGSVSLDGTEMIGASEREWSRKRGRRILWLPQDALAALHPSIKIGRQLREAARLRDDPEPDQAIAEALGRVALANANDLLGRYPHELSGGQRQRVLLATAVVLRPAVLIADEPTSAVDASVRRRLVELLGELRKELDFGLIVISHDLHVVRRLSGRILVLHRGQVAEEGSVEEVMASPKSDYTQRLVAAAAPPKVSA